MLLTSAAYGSDLSLPVTGNLLGSIIDSSGTPQRGATGRLFDKYEQLVARTTSNADGRFAFAAVPIDSYSLSASLASFLPASKDSIAIRAGMDSVIRIQLATLFSNIEVSYVVPNGAMTDDWKWVLRSSPATRPVTRLLEEADAGAKPPVFSETHAVLSLSGGDGGTAEAGEPFGDIGAGFALSTNVLGRNRIQLSGRLGDTSVSGPPTVALTATYSRDLEGIARGSSELALAMSQVGGLVSPLSTTESASNSVLGGYTPMRTLSLSVYQATDPTDRLHVEYGISGESVDYVQHASRISPFVRVSINAGAAGEWIAAYSDGARPDALLRHSNSARNIETENMNNDRVDGNTSSARLPLLSRRHGRLKLQRTQNAEIGFRKELGSRTYAASVFRETVWNGRINVSGDLSGLEPGDLLSDSLSATSTYDIGNYRRSGYIVSADQKLGDNVNLTLAYGRMGGFGAYAPSDGARNRSNSLLVENSENIAAVNVKMAVPLVGTQLSGDYGWVSHGTVIPQHV